MLHFHHFSGHASVYVYHPGEIERVTQTNINWLAHEDSMLKPCTGITAVFFMDKAFSKSSMYSIAHKFDLNYTALPLNILKQWIVRHVVNRMSGYRVFNNLVLISSTCTHKINELYLDRFVLHTVQMS